MPAEDTPLRDSPCLRPGAGPCFHGDLERLQGLHYWGASRPLRVGSCGQRDVGVSRGKSCNVTGQFQHLPAASRRLSCPARHVPEPHAAPSLRGRSANWGPRHSPTRSAKKKKSAMCMPTGCFVVSGSISYNSTLYPLLTLGVILHQNKAIEWNTTPKQHPTCWATINYHLWKPVNIMII